MLNNILKLSQMFGFIAAQGNQATQLFLVLFGLNE
jgi:hypothetical protein